MASVANELFSPFYLYQLLVYMSWCTPRPPLPLIPLLQFSRRCRGPVASAPSPSRGRNGSSSLSHALLAYSPPQAVVLVPGGRRCAGLRGARERGRQDLHQAPQPAHHCAAHQVPHGLRGAAQRPLDGDGQRGARGRRRHPRQERVGPPMRLRLAAGAFSPPLPSASHTTQRSSSWPWCSWSWA